MLILACLLTVLYLSLCGPQSREREGGEVFGFRLITYSPCAPPYSIRHGVVRILVPGNHGYLIILCVK